ncbi:MAG: ABC transporter ATP-binding protein [Acidobacteria bacterium]|nr:MAG: ABC transporter ATP-binding protein [Acidobacteriota bacterium]
MKVDISARAERNISIIKLHRRFLRYPARHWPALIGLLAAMTGATVLEVLKPWPMKILVDHVLKSQQLPETLQWLQLLPGAATRDGLLLWSLAGNVLLFLFSWSSGLARTCAKIAFNQRLNYALAADLFGHLQRLSLRFHNRISIGDHMRRVSTDSSCISGVMDALLPVLTSLLSLIMMFTIMWQMNAALTLLSLAVLPLMILTFRLYAQPMQERSYAQAEIEGRMYGVLEQTLSAIPVVQAFSGEERADRRFFSTSQNAIHAILATTNVQLQFKVLMGFATAAGTALVLWVGARDVLQGSFTVGGILVFLSYLNSLYGPLQSLMYSPSSLYGAAGGARRVLEILEAEPEVKEKAGARPMPAVKGHVRLENVTFGYEPGQPVLRDVSLEARPGQTIALVGATGAGKSTLVSLVPRFFDPWNGRVTIDGHDLRDVQLKSLRSQISLVLQDSFLFPITIAENIAYGRPDASQKEIEAAARAANAHHFIERLAQGYDTIVGERGATLSGGERQRTSIARALLKNAPILILDEPTSALDAETEGLLLQALQTLIKGRTTFIIAHRLSTIRNADEIVVIEHGMLREIGTHTELLATNGLYRRYYNLQHVSRNSQVMAIDQMGEH